MEEVVERAPTRVLDLVSKSRHFVRLCTDLTDDSQSYFSKIALRSRFMVIVEIEKSGDMTLGKWFSELRSWFDHNHCQPTLFNQSERVMGKVIFNITFSDEAQARLFASTFARYAPSIRRTTSIERADLRKTLEPAIAPIGVEGIEAREGRRHPFRRSSRVMKP